MCGRSPSSQQRPQRGGGRQRLELRLSVPTHISALWPTFQLPAQPQLAPATPRTSRTTRPAAPAPAPARTSGASSSSHPPAAQPAISGTALHSSSAVSPPSLSLVFPLPAPLRLCTFPRFSSSLFSLPCLFLIVHFHTCTCLHLLLSPLCILTDVDSLTSAHPLDVEAHAAHTSQAECGLSHPLLSRSPHPPPPLPHCPPSILPLPLHSTLTHLLLIHQPHSFEPRRSAARRLWARQRPSPVVSAHLRHVLPILSHSSAQHR